MTFRPLFIVDEELDLRASAIPAPLRRVSDPERSARPRAEGSQPVRYRCHDDDGNLVCRGRVWLTDASPEGDVVAPLTEHAAGALGATRLEFLEGSPQTWQRVV